MSAQVVEIRPGEVRPAQRCASHQVTADQAAAVPQPYPPHPFQNLRPRGLQMDFGTLLGKLERTLRWLDRHQVEVVAFACSTLRGARVHARGTARLHQMLADELASRGHHMTAAGRFEQMEARDPSTGVLICWEEEVAR